MYNFMKYYQLCGYDFIPVPVFCGSDILNITKPNNAPICTKSGFVASGEQSFLHLILHNDLKYGNYQCITPCVRMHDEEDYIHQKVFIKLELISINPKDPQYELMKMLFYCYAIFSCYTKNLNITKTESGFDININNIEIGSYGVRKYKDITWVYGTGIALPRFIIGDRQNDLSSE